MSLWGVLPKGRSAREQKRLSLESAKFEFPIRESNEGIRQRAGLTGSSPCHSPGGGLLTSAFFVRGQGMGWRDRSAEPAANRG